MKFSEIIDWTLLWGESEDSSEYDKERIKTFNIFCFVWYLLACLMFFQDYIESGGKEVREITKTACIIMVPLVGINQCMHYLNRYIYYLRIQTYAYVFFIFNIIALTFYFANYLYPAFYLEYYYLLIAPVGLVFFDNKWINRTILFFACLFFFLPNLYFNHYPNFESQTNGNVHFDMAKLFLIFAVYKLVNTFKKERINREEKLEKKSKVLKNANEKLAEKSIALENTNEKLHKKSKEVEVNNKELKRKNEEIQQLNKKQLWLFAKISYNISTNLQLIVNQSYKLLEHDLQGIKENIDKASTNIQKLIKETIELAKPENSTPELVLKELDILPFITKIYYYFKSTFKEKNVQLTLIENQKNYTANINEDRFYLALYHIVENSLKYTKQGGTVSIGLERKEDNIVIVIKDNGIGIPEKDISKIFNLHYQASNHKDIADKNTGLGSGLTIAKEAIDSHFGRIEVTSTLNEGSVFEIIIPLIGIVDSKNPTMKDTTLNSEKAKNGKIIVVNNDIEIRKYLAETVLNNHNCFEVGNEKEALRKIKKEDIDLVITDLMGQKKDSFSFIEQVRKNKQRYVAILILTANLDASIEVIAYEKNIDGYIVIPTINPNEIPVKVNNILSKKISIKEETKAIGLIRQIKVYIDNQRKGIVPKLEDIANAVNYESIDTLNSKLEKIKNITYQLNIDDAYQIEIKEKFDKKFSLKNLKELLLMQKAKRIVESNPDISLKEICAQIGYEHNSNFSAKYREYFKEKPPWSRK